MNELTPEFSSYSISSLYSWGLECIRIIQGIQNPVLSAAMKLITNVVSEFVFFGAVMFLFWVINERKAFRLGMLILMAAWLNSLAKAAFQQPRPFHLESALGMVYESNYGFPSGHAQFIMSFTIPLAYWFCSYWRRRTSLQARSGGLAVRITVWIVSVLLILLVSFSRLYLGLHFPQDILGGWILGGLTLAVYFVVEKRFSTEAVIANHPAANRLRALAAKPRFRLIAAAVITVLMNALVPNHSSSAMFFGFAAGYMLMRSYFPFHPGLSGGPRPAERFIQNALRLAIGFTGAAVLYIGLKKIFPGAASSHYSLFRFIRYALLGFWVSGGAPWVFLRLKGSGGNSESRGS
jgi:membrane-associated phospholipid phosphatase